MAGSNTRGRTSLTTTPALNTTEHSDSGAIELTILLILGLFTKNLQSEQVRQVSEQQPTVIIFAGDIE